LKDSDWPREADADRFWKSILQIPNLFDREKSVAAQPSMLKSIARVFYEIKWSDLQSFLESEGVLL
jgi:hypothetical protein